MIVDTSAVIAIALQEPGWEAVYQRAIMAPELLMSCGTLQELLIVAYRKGIGAEMEALLAALDLNYVSVDQELALQAVELYQRYGNGGEHPAQLNFGDCFAAALATICQVPLLYTGVSFEEEE